MKNKIIFAFILTILCLVLFGSVNAMAKTYGDLTYDIYNDEVTITDCAETVTKVEIPSKIDGYPVTAIGDYAFECCTNLTSIVIPDGVTTIGFCAFHDCDSLTGINCLTV